MRHGLLLLASTTLLLCGCAQHSKGYDDAFAACQAQAIEQVETAGVRDDQRAEWEQNFINNCMEKKGFKA